MKNEVNHIFGLSEGLKTDEGIKKIANLIYLPIVNDFRYILTKKAFKTNNGLL